MKSALMNRNFGNVGGISYQGLDVGLVFSKIAVLDANISFSGGTNSNTNYVINTLDFKPTQIFVFGTGYSSQNGSSQGELVLAYGKYFVKTSASFSQSVTISGTNSYTIYLDSVNFLTDGVNAFLRYNVTSFYGGTLTCYLNKIFLMA